MKPVHWFIFQKTNPSKGWSVVFMVFFLNYHQDHVHNEESSLSQNPSHWNRTFRHYCILNWRLTIKISMYSNVNSRVSLRVWNATKISKSYFWVKHVESELSFREKRIVSSTVLLLRCWCDASVHHWLGRSMFKSVILMSTQLFSLALHSMIGLLKIYSFHKDVGYDLMDIWLLFLADWVPMR